VAHEITRGRGPTARSAVDDHPSSEKPREELMLLKSKLSRSGAAAVAVSAAGVEQQWARWMR
jgi:hypothetical protein